MLDWTLAKTQATLAFAAILLRVVHSNPPCGEVALPQGFIVHPKLATNQSVDNCSRRGGVCQTEILPSYLRP